MRVQETAIPDVKILHPDVHKDQRGLFLEAWNQRDFRNAGLDLHFVQDNHSRSERGTLRGLHYQIVRPQGKLVRVVAGTVFDVAVDLRKSSASFGKWVGITLTDQHHEMLWIPPGFAHGFLVLTETADFLYKCTAFYAPQHERTILWNDSELGIEWPIGTDVQPVLSGKDHAGQPFHDADYYP